MTNASAIRHVKKIDEPSSNRTTNLDRGAMYFLPYQNRGKEDIDRDISTINGQQSQEQIAGFSRQEDKRVTGSCQLNACREMNENLKKMDNVINDVIKNLQSFHESDSSYESIADLQELLRKKSMENKSNDQSVVDVYNVSFEKHNSCGLESYDQDSSDGDGQIKHKHSVTRNHPYSKSPAEWSPRYSIRNQSCNETFTRKQQNVDRSFLDSNNGEMKNFQENEERSILDNEWSNGNNDRIMSNPVNDVITSIPSIVVNDHCENSVSTIYEQGGFQGYAHSDASCNSVFSPAPRTWEDSLFSCHNFTASAPNSRCSSRAQSPGVQLESQLIPYNVIGSPLGSPQMSSMYMTTQGQSSPSSSTRSNSDTPSPLDYISPVNQQTEDQLHDDFSSVTIWGTYNIEEQRNITGNNVASLDNDMELVDQFLQDIRNESEGNEDHQVPNSSQSFDLRFDDKPQQIPIVPPGVYSDMSSEQNKQSQVFPLTSIMPDTDDTSAMIPSYFSLNNNLKSINQNMTTSNVYEDRQDQEIKCYDYNSVPNMKDANYDNFNELGSSTHYLPLRQENSMFIDNKNATNETNFSLLPASFLLSPIVTPALTDTTRSTSSETEINELKIPEMVYSFESSQPIRSAERNIVPWPSLNLPSIKSSERLKKELNPKEVKKAMISLLKKPVEELAMKDEDGDTELMRLVGNPEELARKKAYLVPLVERLSKVRGALSTTNNHGEDALYLAAMNCPEMPYVAGYLAATMLEKGIDISQKLYHTRGDNLIHSVAARGDTHGEVLAELLALKTTQGNAVFDLSKRNYDGRTALHVAVESHDATGRGLKAMATVRLLIDNGADPNTKEMKCGDTALHMAVALNCDPALIKVLLSAAGYDTVNAIDYNQNTPLHMAAAVSNTISVEKQTEVCWLLIQAGGQSNMQNAQGKTPLALVSAERKDIIKKIFYKKF